ncbi:PIR Superfamily Protein [Plasmodium ovale curtisi]|uniref:PIR Superfamily Protein n=1 Tax=Plasmodium ovale curtisi TaxID=864141 RepID=A0A1A8XBV7_PLAOA|nr:PIR Superfamily Protein [Plasmodium ovale curtisi]
MSVSFKKYPLETLYNEFNEESNVTTSELCQSFRDKDLEFRGIHNFCNKLVRNLKNILNNKLDNNLVTDPCSYLNYWMSNEVFNIVSPNSVKYHTFIAMLLSPWTNTYTRTSVQNMNCSYFSNIFHVLKNIDQFNNIFNFVHNFKYVEENLQFIKQEDKKCYCNYISSFFQQYEQFISICDADHYINCYKLPKHPSEYNPQNFYNQLKCNELNEPNAESQGDPPLDDKDSPSIGIESSESNSFHILPIFSSLFGALLVSLLTYKLTPVGSFLNKRIFNNRRTQENIHNEINNIDLENISEGVNINLDNDSIHITYQQV